MENMSDRMWQTPLAERKKRNCTKWVKSLLYSDRLEGVFFLVSLTFRALIHLPEQPVRLMLLINEVLQILHAQLAKKLLTRSHWTLAVGLECPTTVLCINASVCAHSGTSRT